MTRRVVRNTEEVIQRRVTEEIFEDDATTVAVVEQPLPNAAIVPTEVAIAVSPVTAFTGFLARRSYHG